MTLLDILNARVKSLEALRDLVEVCETTDQLDTLKKLKAKEDKAFDKLIEELIITPL